MEPDSTQNQSFAPTSTKQSAAVPIAILIGFALIAAAIYFSGSKNTTTVNNSDNNPQAEQPSGDPSSINPITAEDHIRGNPNAPIVIVEYSDYDCPFCKNFHETMKQVMQDYGTDGKVAWVYRHFPIQSRHPNAALVSHAAECVAELGGNDAFWTFSDLAYGERTTNEPTNLTRLPEFVATSGVEEAAFGECMDSGRHQKAIEDDLRNAAAIGANGTPHSIIMVGGEQGVINGAQPYSTVKQIIDNLITQLDGQAQ